MDSLGTVRSEDLRAAERLLDEAIAKRDALREPENWSAHEWVDEQGRRKLSVRNVQFELQEHADQQVQRAVQSLFALRRQWLGLSATADLRGQ